jgi:hypothetical protein
MRMTWMLAGVLMATGAMAQEQETEEPVQRNVLSLDVINPTWSRFAVSGERVLSERVSVQLGVALTLVASHSSSQLDDELRELTADSRSFGIELLPAARFYLLGRAPVGLWVGPQLGAGITHDRGTWGTEPSKITSSRRFLSVRGAALAGYSAALGKHVILQAALGVGAFRSLRTEFPASATQPGLVSGDGPRDHVTWEVRPTTQLSLGWAF